MLARGNAARDVAYVGGGALRRSETKRERSSFVTRAYGTACAPYEPIAVTAFISSCIQSLPRQIMPSRQGGLYVRYDDLTPL